MSHSILQLLDCGIACTPKRHGAFGSTAALGRSPVCANCRELSYSAGTTTGLEALPLPSSNLISIDSDPRPHSLPNPDPQEKCILMNVVDPSHTRLPVRPTPQLPTVLSLVIALIRRCPHMCSAHLEYWYDVSHWAMSELPLLQMP